MVSDAAKAISSFLTRKRQSGRVVTATPDFKRILALPRRAPVANAEVDPVNQPGVTHAQLWTDVLRLPGCTDKLNDEQGWGLSEAFLQKGLLADYAVGTGKTWLSFLIPTVVPCERPLIIMPAGTLKKKTLVVDYPEALGKWRLHPNLKFISYETLDRGKQADFLERHMIDLIVADEVHKLKDPKRSSTARILRYKEKYDWLMMCGMSGTLTSKSLREYAHLAMLCLGEGSPLPLRWMAVEDFSDALDEEIEDEFRPSPGALLQFCKAGETARTGFQRRLRETPGYVSVLTSSVRCSLFISESKVEVPQVVKDAVKKLRLNGVTPTGEIVPAGLAFRQHIAELNSGYCHSWVWPGGVRDLPWINTRRAWRKFVNWIIVNSGRASGYHDALDTEMQVALLADRGALPPPHPDLQVAANVREAWVKERNRLALELKDAFHGVTWDPEECVTWDSKREPPRRATWISDYMVQHAKQWLENNERAIVWSDQRAFQSKMRLEGVLVFGGGDEGIVKETRNCVASIKAHGEGKNLQHAYSRNLMVSVLASGKGNEQLLGRTHRQGQPEDEVTAELVLSYYEAWAAFEKARRHAGYIFETTGRAQKLKYADIDVPSADEVAIRAARWPREPMWCTDWSRTQKSHENEMRELGILPDAEDDESEAA